jgi:hypothetical protein
MKRGLRRHQLIKKLRQLQDATPGVQWAARQELTEREGWTLEARRDDKTIHRVEGLTPVPFARYIDAILAGIELARSG